MSIIFKALKKAEREKAITQELSGEKELYFSKKRIPWVILIAVVAIGAGLFLGFNLIIKGKGQRIDVAPQAKEVISQTKEVTPQSEKAASAPEKPGRDLYPEAVDAFKKGEMKTAETLLLEALKIDPKNAVIHNDLGVVFRKQGRLDDALKEYNEALKINPDLPEALNNIGVIYDLKGDKTKALQSFKKAIRIKPSYPEAHLNVALFLHGTGRSKEAEGHFHTFLNLSNREDLKLKVKERMSALPE